MSFDPISFKYARDVQSQLDQAISAGNPLDETRQARVDKDGITHLTLKQRLDNDVSKTEQKLSQHSQLLEQKTRLSISDTPPSNPAAADFWFEDFGETVEFGSGLVIGNASLDGDGNIWFDEI